MHKLSLLVIPALLVSSRAFVHLPSAQRDVITRRHQLLNKRDGSDRFTWFPDGLGACGNYNSPGDYIIALSTLQWDGGSHCGEKVTLSYGGKTAVAIVADECQECPYNAIDLSRGLFSYFADPDGVGEVYGTWSYGDESTPTSTSTTTRATTTKAPPTITKASSTTTSSWSQTTTTTSTTTSTTPHSTSTSTSQTHTSTSTAPTSTPTVALNDPQVINVLNVLYLQLTLIVMTES